MKNNWQVRAGKGGVCDYKENYDFFFKWLANKVMSCFVIRDESEDTSITETINWDYLKVNLLLDGEICVTDFQGKLYACIGARGGAPNEYYLPTTFIIANPVLGSKQVKIGENGVVIYNTKIDQFLYNGQTPIFSGGLGDLVSQTAALLADNIISINCTQINLRATVFFTAESSAQALAAEEVLKKQYAGKPYQVMRESILEHIKVNPVNQSANGSNITELVELHNYIIANFFQSIGIKSNNVMKRERLISDEIETQNNYLELSVLEIVTAWQAGFDEINKMYGTNIKVELNPVLIDDLIDELEGAEPEAEADGEDEGTEPEQEDAAAATEGAEPEAEADGEPEEDKEEIVKDIEKKEDVIKDVVDLINDKDEDEDKEEGEEDNEELEADED